MNLFDMPETLNNSEIFEELFSNKHTRIKKIISPTGCELEKDWYNQEEDEFVVLIKGSATIEFKNKEVKLSEGDTFVIPANCPHRVKEVSSLQDTIWLAIYMKA